MSSRGGRGHRGRGSGPSASKSFVPRTSASLTPEIEGRFVRYCVWCKEVVENQALHKSSRCSRANCRLRVPIRDAPSGRTGWVHCRSCDAFIHNYFYFCNICGQATDDTTGTKKKIVDIRRLLFAKNPENFKKTGDISTADLGGDRFLATPTKVSKKRKLEFDSDSDGDSTIASIVEDPKIGPANSDGKNSSRGVNDDGENKNTEDADGDSSGEKTSAE